MPTSRRAATILLIGFVLLSLNTRVPFGQIGPLAPVAGFNPTLVTILGMLPPLGMGIAAPFVPLLLRRTDDDRLLLWASFAALAGAVVRAFDVAGLLAGTCVTALAIGVINVLIPVYVRRRFAGPRSGPVFGAYALAMGLGSALAAAVAVPVATATGQWELAIAVAVVPAVLAVLGGIMMLDRKRAEPVIAAGAATAAGAEAVGGAATAAGATTVVGAAAVAGSVAGAADGGSAPNAVADDEEEPLLDEPVAQQFAQEVGVGRSWLAWSLLFFFGVQTLLFYALLAWLPSILVESGAGSGAGTLGQTILILGIALGGFVAPIVGARHPSQSSVVVAIIALCAVGMLGLVYLPALSLTVWVPLLGLGLGGGQALPAVMYAHRGASHEHTAALSAFAQTGGFLLAAVGPLLMSVGYRASGSWALPLVVLSVICVGNVVLSWRGSRAVAA